jgi:hypothetical protein
MPVTLQFVQGTNVFDKAIIAYSHGWPTHVDGVMPNGQLLGSQSHSIGSIPEGVQIRPPNYETFAKVLRVDIPATPAQEGQLWAFLEAQLHKPYDHEAIFGMALDRDWHDPGSWFCSELYGAALEASEIFPFPLSTATYCLAPSGLLLACSVIARINAQ